MVEIYEIKNTLVRRTLVCLVIAVGMFLVTLIRIGEGLTDLYERIVFDAKELREIGRDAWSKGGAQ